jgi:two-component system, chemotaxis family, CheB/CheR fusion protein
MNDQSESAGTASSTPEPHVPVCAIGASAGGVKALQSFFEKVDPDLGLAYVVIVHLSPEHDSQLSEILANRTSMPVRQVEDSPQIEPNCVYVIAPDRELVIEGNSVHSRPFSEPRGRRAPIDMFFRSVAAARGDGFCVVLSGAGSDGALGAAKMKEAGAVVLVQDPREAEYGAMPRSAIAAGTVDFVEPLDRLLETLAAISRHKDALRALGENEAEDDLRQILAFLRARTGHDFSSYKRATVMRRVKRRMQVTRKDTPAAYAAYLQENPEEAQELLGDLLISVTAFFRDPAAFEALATEALTPLLRDVGSEGQLRIWSVGCATGEEAYSLAMVLLEEAERLQVMPQIQVFASDLDDGALATAREGLYPKSIAADVSDERLRRFFIDDGSHYRIRKEVRDLVLFAHHSALKDPPFMRIDLISCRNLLIYLERELQRQLLALFHYALRPGGMLFLGSAESVDTRPDLFTPCDREARVYAAKPRSSREIELLTQLPRQNRPMLPGGLTSRPDHPPRAAPQIHAAALEELAPPSVLVDEDHRVLNLSRTAGTYIRPPEGPLSSELPALVRPELRAELRRALHRAIDHGEPTLTLPSSIEVHGVQRRVILHVLPVPGENRVVRRALVMFLDAGPSGGDAEGAVSSAADMSTISPDQVRQLEIELKATQDQLSASRREHERAIQELRISNEELQSINEEYRSTAEELETSKEELQSINEELNTVNTELKGKLDSIASAHSDLQNLVNATEIGTLFLDGDLRIRMLTPAVEQLFNVTDSDVGRPISDFTHKLVHDGVESEAAKVLKELVPIESEVATKDGRWLMMRLRPYRTVEDRIDGVVVSFVDISERRNAEARLRESEAKYRRLFENMDEGYLLAEVIRDDAGHTSDVCYVEANPAARRQVKVDFVGHRLSEVLTDIEPYWWEVPVRVLETGDAERAELYSRALDQWFDVGATRIDDRHVAILFKDVSERKRNERERELMLHELNHRVKNMLTVVQSIANQTLRTTGDPAAFAAVFGQRIRALSAAHNLLSDDHWTGADLTQLVHAALASFVPEGARRILAKGPAVRLSPNATVSFVMALHELGTNAVKYGALSNEAGQVELFWAIEAGSADDGGAALIITWNERGGPEVAPPEREGFGQRMLEKGIARELNGEVELDYKPAGLVCKMRFPLEKVISRAER